MANQQHWILFTWLVAFQHSGQTPIHGYSIQEMDIKHLYHCIYI